jgi:hypothetical protein
LCVIAADDRHRVVERDIDIAHSANVLTDHAHKQHAFELIRRRDLARAFRLCVVM